MVKAGFIWLMTGGSYCDHGNKHSVSIKAEQFLDQVRIY
jgi:hypothetical protein